MEFTTKEIETRNIRVSDAQQSGVALSRNDWLIQAVTERLKAEILQTQLDEEREMLDKLRQAQPTIHMHVDGGYVWTVCAECGPDVPVDEDGCCVSCGRDSLQYGKAEVV